MDEIHDHEGPPPLNGSSGSDTVSGDQGNKRRIGYGQPPDSPSTRFRPGVSGNPAGRPKGASLTDRLRSLLDQREIAGKALPDGKQVADLVVEALVKQALKGGSRHIAEIYNRIDGKLTEHLIHSGVDGGPIAIDAAVCGLSSQEIDAWREKKRAEIAEKRSNTLNVP